METIRAAEREEAAYDRRMYRYKAQHSLDCDNGIENAILLKPQTPEMALEEKQLREQLYAAVMALPDKQASGFMPGITWVCATLDAARNNGLISYVQYVQNGCVYFTAAGLQEYGDRGGDYQPNSVQSGPPHALLFGSGKRSGASLHHPAGAASHY